MKKLSGLEVLGYLGLLAMTFVWMVASGYIFRTGGFYKSYRHSTMVTYVDGPAAVFMAGLFLSLAAISATMILKRFAAPRAVTVVAVAAILVSPFVYCAFA